MPLSAVDRLPHQVLACNELYNSMHAVRMWFSRGNTTSSQHFDTHDNLMLQIDGIKDILLESSQ